MFSKTFVMFFHLYFANGVRQALKRRESKSLYFKSSLLLTCMIEGREWGWIVCVRRGVGIIFRKSTSEQDLKSQLRDHHNKLPQL